MPSCRPNLRLQSAQPLWGRRTFCRCRFSPNQVSANISKYLTFLLTLLTLSKSSIVDLVDIVYIVDTVNIVESRIYLNHCDQKSNFSLYATCTEFLLDYFLFCSFIFLSVFFWYFPAEYQNKLTSHWLQYIISLVMMSKLTVNVF